MDRGGLDVKHLLLMMRDDIPKTMESFDKLFFFVVPEIISEARRTNSKGVIVMLGAAQLLG